MVVLDINMSRILHVSFTYCNSQLTQLRSEESYTYVVWLKYSTGTNKMEGDDSAAGSQQQKDRLKSFMPGNNAKENNDLAILQPPEKEQSTFTDGRSDLACKHEPKKIRRTFTLQKDKHCRSSKERRRRLLTAQRKYFGSLPQSQRKRPSVTLEKQILCTQEQPKRKHHQRHTPQKTGLVSPLQQQRERERLSPQTNGLISLRENDQAQRAKNQVQAEDRAQAENRVQSAADQVKEAKKQVKAEYLVRLFRRSGTISRRSDTSSRSSTTGRRLGIVACEICTSGRGQSAILFKECTANKAVCTPCERISTIGK